MRMENEYEENLPGRCSRISMNGGIGTESGCSFDSAEKVGSAGHAFSEGTIDRFGRFDALHTLAEEILRKTECAALRTAIPCSATGSRSLDGFRKLIQAGSSAAPFASRLAAPNLKMPSPHFFGQEGIGAERAGVRFAGRDKPVHRIGWGEVQLCRLRRFAERLDRAGRRRHPRQESIRRADTAWLIRLQPADRTRTPPASIADPCSLPAALTAPPARP